MKLLSYPRINCDISDDVAQSVSMIVTSCDVPPFLQVNVHTKCNGCMQVILANDNTTTSLSELMLS